MAITSSSEATRTNSHIASVDASCSSGPSTFTTPRPVLRDVAISATPLTHGPRGPKAIKRKAPSDEEIENGGIATRRPAKRVKLSSTHQKESRKPRPKLAAARPADTSSNASVGALHGSAQTKTPATEVPHEQSRMFREQSDTTQDLTILGSLPEWSDARSLQSGCHKSERVRTWSELLQETLVILDSAPEAVAPQACMAPPSGVSPGEDRVEAARLDNASSGEGLQATRTEPSIIKPIPRRLPTSQSVWVKARECRVYLLEKLYGQDAFYDALKREADYFNAERCGQETLQSEWQELEDFFFDSAECMGPRYEDSCRSAKSRHGERDELTHAAARPNVVNRVTEGIEPPDVDPHSTHKGSVLDKSFYFEDEETSCQFAESHGSSNLASRGPQSDIFLQQRLPRLSTFSAYTLREKYRPMAVRGTPPRASRGLLPAPPAKAQTPRMPVMRARKRRAVGR